MENTAPHWLLSNLDMGVDKVKNMDHQNWYAMNWLLLLGAKGYIMCNIGLVSKGRGRYVAKNRKLLELSFKVEQTEIILHYSLLFISKKDAINGQRDIKSV